MSELPEPCPCCGALPVDWTKTPAPLVPRISPADREHLETLAGWFAAIGNQEDAALMNRLLETKPAAIGAHPAPLAPRWMPIATAPMDGLVILLLQGGEVFAGFCGDDPTYPWCFLDRNVRDAFVNRFRHDSSPTHWTNLPEPPTDG